MTQVKIPIIYKKFITRKFVRENPSYLFIFGDNLERTGFGGQAKEMRGEPNAWGIATKRAPHMGKDAFFSDKPDEFLQVEDDLDSITVLWQTGLFDLIVWPMDGIGAGLAQLQRRSPMIASYIDEWLISNTELLQFLD